MLRLQSCHDSPLTNQEEGARGERVFRGKRKHRTKKGKENNEKFVCWPKKGGLGKKILGMEGGVGKEQRG